VVDRNLAGHGAQEDAVVRAGQDARARQADLSTKVCLDVRLYGAIGIESANRKVSGNGRHHDVAFSLLAIRL